MAAADAGGRPLATLLVPSLLLGGGALAFAWSERPKLALYDKSAFQMLFARDEPWGAALLVALTIGAAVLGSALARRAERFVEGWARHPRVVALLGLLLLAAGAWTVYRAAPLSMDEYAPWFQARIFAAGHIATRLPPDLLPWLLPPRLLYPFFATDVHSGAVASAYWPGFALLMAPFSLLRVEWLLDPVLGAACLLMIARLAGRWTGSRAASGWAMLLTLASTAFTANAISFYPLTAHLLANLIWMDLLTEGRAGDFEGVRLTGRTSRLLLAGIVGSFALVLHNPVPHAIFALPWMWALLRRRGVRALATLWIGYLPLALCLGVGWWFGVRQALGIHAPVAAETGASRGGLMALESLVEKAFTLPAPWVLRARLMGLVELTTWAAPFLPVLAALGWWGTPRRSPLRLLAASAALTIVAYCFVPFDQGHGWGYRYFHAAWAALPLLAASVLVTSSARRWRGAVLAGALLALPCASALRAWQVQSFIDEHAAQLPPSPPQGRAIVLLDVIHGFYRVDLVQNDPYLRNRVLVMASYGERYDREMLAQRFAGARLVQRYPTGSVWSLPAGSPPPAAPP